MFSILQNPRNVILLTRNAVHSREIYISMIIEIYLCFYMKNNLCLFPYKKQIFLSQIKQ